MTEKKYPSKRQIDGVLLLDKAEGITSNTALQQVRRLYRAEKAGHTGILDPFATGLLPVCFGQATKFAGHLLDADKAYIATMRFGAQTDTGDLTGQIIAQNKVFPDADSLWAACQAMLGGIWQTPPMYSALKHQGRALYEYARQGITIERPARAVCIHKIEILAHERDIAVIMVQCSKGTYIRTLAEDIAAKAGAVAHLTALRRTLTAGFNLQQAYNFIELNQKNETERDALLLPCDAMLTHFAAVDLDEAAAKHIRCGRLAQTADEYPGETILRAYDMAGQFIGLVATTATGYLKAVRLMDTARTI